MVVKKLFLTVSVLFSMSMFAQDLASNEVVEPEVKISYIDSIKSTFVKDKSAARVDSLWMNELASLAVYDDLKQDIKTSNTDRSVDQELPTELLKQRLQAMNEKSPFAIEYNQSLENLIKSFLKNRKKSFSHLMALSEYYFPIFEDAFAKQEVPLEIKYLAVVESALNPKAVSRMGAAGLWQFMYGTGKQYNLKIDSYIDERKDPLKSTAAATEYMSKMYKIFGDWELVLASYNSGPGNVSKAIRRSGGKTKYWDIRNQLPKETQSYVPAFLATMYLFEYHKEHGINPDKAAVKNYETDTIRIRDRMSFKQISDLLDIPQSQLELLNPSYKLDVIPYYQDEQLFLRLPKDKMATFVTNEDKIYTYLRHEKGFEEFPTQLAFTIAPKNKIIVKERINWDKNTKLYKVQKGDNLNSIAQKYNVSIINLVRWNHLKGNFLASGRILRVQQENVRVKKAKGLKIIPEIDKNETQEVVVSKEDKEKTALHLKTNPVVSENTLIVSKKIETINDNSVAVASNAVDTFKKKAIPSEKEGENYYVKKGDSLYSISRKYPGVSISDIKKWNNIKSGTIKPGMKLKING